MVRDFSALVKVSFDKLPGMVGTPASAATRLDAILSPIPVMAWASGPIKLTPFSS